LLTPISPFYRYTVEHPSVTPNSIAASKDFMRDIAFGMEGKYNDPKACLSSIVQTYKNFIGGWQWAGNEKIDDRVTLSTLNVGLQQLLWLILHYYLLMMYSLSNILYKRSSILLVRSERGVTAP
jgi:hypothetical protein